MERVRRSPEPIVRMVAHSQNHARLLADLHARAVLASGASRSILLEFDPVRKHLRPTSSSGPDFLQPDPWIELPDSVSLAYELFASGHPRQIAPLATLMPDLALRLASPAAILAPVVSNGHGLGLLVLAVSVVVPALEWMDQVASCADGFALTLARARLELDVARQHDIDALVLVWLGSGTSHDDPSALEQLSVGLARAFGAERVSVWLHDRVARRVTVAAASDGSHRRRPASSPTSGADALLVKALRGTSVEVMHVATAGGSAPLTNAAVPLRGQRRALGVLVFQGMGLAPGDEGRLTTVLTRLGHTLANALESRQLLEDVIGARRELEYTFDAMDDVVIVSDRHHRITRVNRAARERLGLAPDRLAGRLTREVVGPALAAWLDTLPLETPELWPTRGTDVEDARLGGTFRVTAMPLARADRSLTGLVIVGHDITDEQRLEGERAAMRERLARSEALSNIVAGIAHELNNPLQAVLGHLELARRSQLVPSALDAPLNRVDMEARRAARIVRNLLLLAGGGRLRPRRISSARALAGALSLRAAVCRRLGIVVQRSLPPILPPTTGDAVLLRQAFLNILTNAEQALAGREGGRIEVTASVTGETIVIAIHDNGEGLAPDVAARVFDPFFTTRVGGSGLGLALTRRIITEFGGAVEAGNHPDGGALFTVSLPAAPVVRR